MSSPWVLASPYQQQFDTITILYPDSVTEVYTYRIGGLTGQVVMTLTVVYTDSSKDNIQSVIRNPLVTR